jgi:hypothetical protein
MEEIVKHLNILGKDFIYRLECLYFMSFSKIRYCKKFYFHNKKNNEI